MSPNSQKDLCRKYVSILVDSHVKISINQSLEVLVMILRAIHVQFFGNPLACSISLKLCFSPP